MPFIGTPLDTRNTFQSLQGKRFNGDGSTTDFTLDVAPGNVLDIEVFVGNVRQDPNSAYTVSGTTLSFTGAPPSGTNNIYVVHQAKSVGTIDVPTGGVAAGSLATSVLTGQTDIGADIADADLFLVDDGAGGTLRKTAASRIKTYVGGGVNTPLFYVKTTSDQSISDNTYTKVNWGVEVIDTGSAFASDKFTVPSGQAGKYYFGAGVQFGDNTTQQYHYVDLRKNNTVFSSQPTGTGTTSNDTNRYYQPIEALVDLSAGDYVEVFALSKFTSGTGTMNYSYFIGYKLIE